MQINQYRDDNRMDEDVLEDLIQRLWDNTCSIFGYAEPLDLPQDILNAFCSILAEFTQSQIETAFLNAIKNATRPQYVTPIAVYRQAMKLKAV